MKNGGKIRKMEGRLDLLVSINHGPILSGPSNMGKISL